MVMIIRLYRVYSYVIIGIIYYFNVIMGIIPMSVVIITIILLPYNFWNHYLNYRNRFYSHQNFSQKLWANIPQLVVIITITLSVNMPQTYWLPYFFLPVCFVLLLNYLYINNFFFFSQNYREDQKEMY